MRSGSTPKEGPYAKNIRDGLDFVCKEIAAADEHERQRGAREGDQRRNQEDLAEA